MLSLNIKTAGDWLKVKRLEKNLTPGQVAAKMGIATSLVCSWESGPRRPDGPQLEVLSSALGFAAQDFEAHASKPLDLQCWAYSSIVFRDNTSRLGAATTLADRDLLKNLHGYADGKNSGIYYWNYFDVSRGLFGPAVLQVEQRKSQ